MRLIQVAAAAALLAAGCQDANDNGIPSTPSAPSVSALVVRTDLVTDATDGTLVNAWGMAFNPIGAVWISANGSGLSEVYDGTGKELIPRVSIPPAMSAPTGQVFNADMTAFSGDKFIFVTEDGVISGWQGGAAAVVRVDNSGAHAVYKGVAMANDSTGRASSPPTSTTAPSRRTTRATTRSRCRSPTRRCRRASRPSTSRPSTAKSSSPMRSRTPGAWTT